MTEKEYLMNQIQEQLVALGVKDKIVEVNNNNEVTYFISNNGIQKPILKMRNSGMFSVEIITTIDLMQPKIEVSNSRELNTSFEFSKMLMDISLFLTSLSREVIRTIQIFGRDFMKSMNVPNKLATMPNRIGTMKNYF